MNIDSRFQAAKGCPEWVMNSLFGLCMIVFAVFLLPMNTHANPFHIGKYGGLIGSGATHRSPFAVYWNPAGLVNPGLSLQLHGMLVGRQAEFDRDAALNEVPQELVGVNSGLARTTSLGAVPALALQDGHDFNSWHIGIGVAAFVDRAGRTNWDKNLSASSEYPGAVDGPQRWAVINTELTFYNLAVGLGAEHIESGLSLGVSWIGTRVNLATVRARNVNTSDDVLVEGHLAEGRILFRDGEDEGYTLVLGAQWQIVDTFSLGIAWQNEVKYQIEGNSLILFGEAAETSEPATTDLPIPQTIRSEARWQISESLQVRPALTWIGWSILQTQTAIGNRTGEVLFRTPRNFDDIWATSLSFDWQAFDHHMLHLMVGYETGATPRNAHEPGLAESDNGQLGIAASSSWSEGVTTHLSFMWQQFADVTVTNSVQRPTMNGRYKDQRQYLTVDVEFAL